jgi:hypothetical protein
MCSKGRENAMYPGGPLQIVNIDRMGDQLLVGYSDATTAVYGVEQLTTLKPKKILLAESSLEDEQESL